MAADDTLPQSGTAQHQGLKTQLKPWRTPVVILETVSDLTMTSQFVGNDGDGPTTANS